jgi:hypothetical protein
MTAPVIVFLGPTLALADARHELDASYLGPVAQGDVLRAVETRPWAIAIIDGYFARVPAVWHKEILWALTQGVRVFGASSMGALRAAELEPFGMVGVGQVFAGFRSGAYEDDDEVTISHGDADAGFRPLSDAMVDLRATLERAVAEHVIAAPLGADLIARAKALHYTERSYPAVLAAAARAGLPPEPLARLRAWLPDHRVQQKRQDALELLRTLRRLVEAGSLAPFEPSFRFEHTDAWEQLSRRSGHRQTSHGVDPQTTAPLLDELRLAGHGTYRSALDGALARALASAEARRHELAIDDVLLGDAARSFFLHRGTLSPEAIQAWMATERLDAEGLARFLQREARLHWARTLYAAEIIAQLPDQLRATGDLLPLLLRARAKRRLLDQLGEDQLRVDEAEAAPLLDWFFTQRRAQPPPGNADACAQVLGFESGERLLRALALERRFVDATAG